MIFCCRLEEAADIKEGGAMEQRASDVQHPQGGGSTPQAAGRAGQCLSPPDGGAWGADRRRSPRVTHRGNT